MLYYNKSLDCIEARKTLSDIGNVMRFNVCACVVKTAMAGELDDSKATEYFIGCKENTQDAFTICYRFLDTEIDNEAVRAYNWEIPTGTLSADIRRNIFCLYFKEFKVLVLSEAKVSEKKIRNAFHEYLRLDSMNLFTTLSI